MPKPKVLVVDSDLAGRDALDKVLRDWGYEVRSTSDDMPVVRELLDAYKPDVVISDVSMRRRSGSDFVQQLKSGDLTRPVVLVAARGSVDVAVDSMKQGAHDFLTKPLDYPKLHAVLRAAESDIQSRELSRQLSSQLLRESGFGDFVGLSAAMKAVYDLLQTVASSTGNALITGESGTGKGLAARTIHALSARDERPFISVKISSIPEALLETELFGQEKSTFNGAVDSAPGALELANGGTLFLDEISELPMPLQSKLLRTIESRRVRRVGGNTERPVDVRIIVATSRDITRAIEEHRLREDLYYRLTIFHIAIPPLRQHKQDVPLLAQHCIHEFNRKHHVKVEAVRDEAMEILNAYSWPGNVREFKNVMERAVIVAPSEWIETRHLPPYLSTTRLVLPERVTAAEAERQLILRTLERTGHNKAEAARQLGLDVKTIRNKLKTYKYHQY
jgi:DNA-binding NtrC family response regulator